VRADSRTNGASAALERVRAVERTRLRMQRVFTPNQLLGRTQSIGCTAVEITQRCNLDCTLCYLSESAESVHDVPIEEVYRRLEEIRRIYGPCTNVQITGGDPTLRKHDELEAIVRYARALDLYPALFTNGIAASRRVLERLARAGLTDVAFHVDTTQRRSGCASEADLEAVRLDYIERARGLGLAVVFNTTVHAGNFDAIPDLVRFFIAHSDVVGFASFQLQADTGRGEWRKRACGLSLETVRAQVECGAGRTLAWDVARIGHPQCHSYASSLVVNGGLYPVIDDTRLFARYIEDFAGIIVDRRMPWSRIFCRHLAVAARRPHWLVEGLRFIVRHLWRARRDLLAARGRVRKLSIFIHNFMDGDSLDPERVEACSFMLMTADGPMSMCAHNARRDEYILKPITVLRRDGSRMVHYPLGPAVSPGAPARRRPG
jgi:pyruvate-formate lyase-activating enzyme